MTTTNNEEGEDEEETEARSTFRVFEGLGMSLYYLYARICLDDDVDHDDND